VEPDAAATLLLMQTALRAERATVAALQEELARVRAERDELRLRVAASEGDEAAVVAAETAPGGAVPAAAAGPAAVLDEALVERAWRHLEAWQAAQTRRNFPPLLNRFRVFVAQL
jgi:hypothetical protein